MNRGAVGRFTSQFSQQITMADAPMKKCSMSLRLQQSKKFIKISINISLLY